MPLANLANYPATDINGVSRYNRTAAGAVETAETAPAQPVLTAVGGTDVTNNSAKLTFTSNVAGTYYCYATINPGGAPSSRETFIEYANGKATWGTVNIGRIGTAIAGANTVAFTGLEPSMRYFIRVIVENQTGVFTAPNGSYYVIVTTSPLLLSEGSALRISDTEANIAFTVSSNTNGVPTYTPTNAPSKLWYVELANGATPPADNTAIKSTGASISGIAFGENLIPVTLTAGARDIYAVVEDAAGFLSAPLKIEVGAQLNGIINVSNNNDSGDGSLRQAVADASSGAVINCSAIAGQTITLNSNLTVNKTVRIEGFGVSITSTSTSESGGSFEAITVSGSGVSVTINNVRFNGIVSNDRSVAGVTDGALLNFNSCIFSNNSSTADGGALYVAGSSTLNVNGSTFYNNTAGHYGGCIYSSSSSDNTTLTGNLFYGNTAAVNGNIVYRYRGTVTSGGYNVWDKSSYRFTFNGTGDTNDETLRFNTTTFRPTGTELNIVPTGISGFPEADFYGAARFFPDATAGAVQYYAPGFIPPALTAGTVNRTSDTEATIGFTTDKAGTAYYLVQNSGVTTTPTSTAVKAGTVIGSVFGTVSGKDVTLTAGAQNIYVVVEDAAGNISAPLKIVAAAYVSTGIHVNGGGGLSVVAEINAAIIAALAESDTITVTGELDGIMEPLELNIPEDKKVVWKASVSGSNLAERIIELAGNGELEIAGGVIKSPGTTTLVATNAEDHTKLTITGGRIEGPNNNQTVILFWPQTGILTATGGTVAGKIATYGNLAVGGNAVITTSGTAEAISFSGFANTVVTVTGGTITAENANAILIKSGTSDLKLLITGGTISNTTTSNKPVVYADGSTLSGCNNVVFWNGGTITSNGNAPGALLDVNPATNAVAIRKTGAGTEYLAGSNEELDVISAGTATWARQDGKSGVSYMNGTNIGFIEVPGVTVSGNELYVNGGEALTTVAATNAAITAALADNDVVTVTGSLFGVTATFNFNIPAGKKVIWKADVSGNTGNSIISLVASSTGVLEVAGARVIQNGAGYAIQTDADMVVSGNAEIAANSNYAILLNGTNAATLEVTGGKITSNTANAIRLFNENKTVIISGGEVSNSSNANAVIHANANNTAVLVSGGTVTANGSGGKFGVTDDTNGVFIEKTGAATSFVTGTSTALTVTPAEATATWKKRDGKSGISYKNGDNTGFIETPGITVEEYFAISSSTERFGTLVAAAIAVADGGTITMLDDVTVSNMMDVSLSVDKTYTIDFGGKTLGSSGYSLQINNGAVTLKNGNVASYISVEGGNLTVESGIYSGYNNAIWCNGGTVTIISGDFTSTNEASNNSCLITSNSGEILLATGSIADVENWKNDATAVSVTRQAGISVNGGEGLYIVAEINDAIEAALEESDTVTVTGELSNMTEGVELSIFEGKKVVWKASVSGTGTYILYPYGGGVFEFEDASVINNGNGIALWTSTNTVVSGDAVIAANYGYAINYQGNRTTLEITGGTITAQGIAIFFTGGNQTTIISGGEVSNNSNYPVIQAYGVYNTVLVNGGTVTTTGTGGKFRDPYSTTRAVFIEKTGSGTVFVVGTSDELEVTANSTEAVATWARQGGKSGVSYVNGTNTGFIAVDGITVKDDATAPTLTEGTVSRTSDTAATVNFTSDEAGTYYYQLDGEAPTSATALVTTGTNSAAMIAGEQTISPMLTAGAHTLYITAKDAADNVSNMLTVNIPAYTAPSYTVSIATLENGTVLLDRNPADYEEDEIVTLTVTPDEGYEIDAVSAHKTGDAETTVETRCIASVPNGTATYQFTMPDFGVTVAATFEHLISTNMDNIVGAKSIVSESYYDLTGKPVSATAKGFVIKRTVYDDGSVINNKGFIK
ncbi:beta strand repeat-containing protein [Viscerimonas tarda]